MAVLLKKNLLVIEKHNKKDVRQKNSTKKELSLLTQGITSKNINNNQTNGARLVRTK